MNVRWFELGALEAQEFIARITSCLSLLFNQWENFTLKILKSDWSIRKGLFPCPLFHVILINNNQGIFPQNKPPKICLILLLSAYDAISIGCFFLRFFNFITEEGTFPSEIESHFCWAENKERNIETPLNTERSYITRLRCSACQSEIPTDDQCSNLIGLFTQV